jgi:hypothetical protein
MPAVLKRPAARLVKLEPIGAIIGSSAYFTNDWQSAAVAAAAAVNRYNFHQIPFELQIRFLLCFFLIRHSSIASSIGEKNSQVF